MCLSKALHCFGCLFVRYKSHEHVNDVAVLSAMPAIPFNPSLTSKPYISIFQEEGYRPYVTSSHQHMQGVVNLLLCGMKIWRVRSPYSGRVIEIRQTAGQVIYLPPGWYHEVTSYNGAEFSVHAFPTFQ